MIIAVGCRVHSKRGTQFRIWATSVLKDYLVRGYAHNQRRLAEKGTEEVRGGAEDEHLARLLRFNARFSGRGGLDLLSLVRRDLFDAGGKAGTRE